MNPTPRCIVRDCHQPVVHAYNHDGHPWPVCTGHAPQVADLLGIVKPVKESR